MDSGENPRASDSFSNSLDDLPSAGGGVVSEKVQYFANAIYGQLEKLVKKYDEEAVKDLMPHVISLLENLDQLSNEKRQLEVDIELIKEDNSQLLVQYEREKTMRRSIEQKCLEIEDLAEDERQSLNEKLTSMESIVRMLELKSKNSADHVSRLEEKEGEMKKDHQKLYQKYQELMRSHIDIMERRAYNTEPGDMTSAVNSAAAFGHHLLHGGSDELDLDRAQGAPQTTPKVDHFDQVGGLHEFSSNRSPAFMSRGVQNVVSSFGDGGRDGDGFGNSQESDVAGGPHGVASSSNNRTSHNDFRDSASFYGHQSSSHPFAFVPSSNVADDAPKGDEGAMSSRFVEELSFQEEDLLNTPSRGQRLRKGGDNEQDSSDEDAEGEADDTLGSTPLGLSLGGSDFNAPGRQSTFSVGREFDKLLRENAELLETKNALNVVKDDLIFQLDGLNNELRIFRERIASLEEIREHLQHRVTHLEEEGRRTKDELEETKMRLAAASTNNGSAEDDSGSGHEAASTGAENNVTQKRRFTRMEMARVLMERNVYKERLMELQETVRWVEALRASREHPDAPVKKSSSIWNFFGGLFSAGASKPKPTTPAPAAPPPPPQVSSGYLDVGRLPSEVGPERQHRRSLITQSTGSQGRVEAYGWSIPTSTCQSNQTSGMARSRAATRVAGVTTPNLVISKPDVPIPIPVCCQPLPGSLNGMKIWSAAVAFSSVGHHPDGSRLFERSVFYSSPRNSTSNGNESGGGSESALAVSPDVAELEEEVTLEQHRVKAGRGQLAELSTVSWLTCSSNNVNTHVFLVDLRHPSVLLAGFTLDAPYVSQVCAVPGAKPTDITWQPMTTEVGDSVVTALKKDETEPRSDDDCVEMSRDTDKLKAATNKSGWVLSVRDNVETKVVTIKTPGDNLKPRRVHQDDDPKGPLIDNTKSLLMPSMWFGAQDGSLFIYSAAAAVQPAVDDSPQQLPALLGRLQLPAAATAVAHVAGRVFIALSTSELVMFHRNPETKEWVFDQCSVIEFKRDPTAASQNPTAASSDSVSNDNSDPLSASRTASTSVTSSSSSPSTSAPVPAARCLVAVANRYLWVGLGREVLVIEPASLRIESSFVCHPRPDAQLRHACSVGDGVWLAVRIDSVLRLYHAFTHQHLQDLDLTPPIHSFLFGDAAPGSTNALSPMRVSAMVAGGGRLWIGTHTGLVVSVPFASSEQSLSVKASVTTPSAASTAVTKQPTTPTSTPQGPGSVVQVFASPRSHTLTPATNVVPYCWVGGAQISCHGHTDSVKAIVCSPVQASTTPPAEAAPTEVQATPTKRSGVPSLAVMSVGEGYRDCRSAAAIQAAVTATDVGLTAILGGPAAPGASPAGMSISPQSVNLSPAPPGEERIHMIVWQLALSS